MKAFVLGAALLMAAQAVMLGGPTSSFSIVSPDRPRTWLVGGTTSLIRGYDGATRKTLFFWM